MIKTIARYGARHVSGSPLAALKAVLRAYHGMQHVCSVASATGTSSSIARIDPKRCRYPFTASLTEKDLDRIITVVAG